MTEPLVTPVELGEYLRVEVDTKGALAAIRLASGWLHSATNLPSWPDPLPDDLWGWAVELAGLVYGNPAGVERSGLGRSTLAPGAEVLLRRTQILEAARSAYAGGTSDSTGAVGSFPAAEAYPDPACGWTPSGHTG